MAHQYDHEMFLSPFTWRYGSDSMRMIWSEAHKRRLWRRIWVELARALEQAGLVTPEQTADLAEHMNDIDIARAEAIEAEIHHDLMAEVRTFAEQCKIGGSIIHLGATSADIEDNADALRIRDSLDLIISSLSTVLDLFADLIQRYADEPAIAFTHLQPAEPTTVGYRFALYAQDLQDDLHFLKDIRANLRGKGFKGAVGTSASYAELLANTVLSPSSLEVHIMTGLALTPYPVSAQTYPRKQDWRVLSALSGLASSLYKFAFDLRVLQSPVIGEWHEGFTSKQVGSSAMPFKRNPINAEKMNSLGRLVEAFAGTAWSNASHTLLERTLDDSANRREILPTTFLAVDEMLHTGERILRSLQVNTDSTRQNLEKYGVFAASERLLMASVKRGADRQEAHEVIRELSMAAWADITHGMPIHLAEMLKESAFFRQYFTPEEIASLLDSEGHVGDASERAKAFAEQLVADLRRG